VSYALSTGAERTLSWRGGDNGKVPDSFTVGGAMPSSSAESTYGRAVMNLYAGRVIGWTDAQAPGESLRIPDVLLKEYVNEAAAALADAEVEAYMRLYSAPADSVLQGGVDRDGNASGAGAYIRPLLSST
jgi:hypothetical protein